MLRLMTRLGAVCALLHRRVFDAFFESMGSVHEGLELKEGARCKCTALLARAHQLVLAGFTVEVVLCVLSHKHIGSAHAPLVSYFSADLATVEFKVEVAVLVVEFIFAVFRILALRTEY